MYFVFLILATTNIIAHLMRFGKAFLLFCPKISIFLRLKTDCMREKYVRVMTYIIKIRISGFENPETESASEILVQHFDQFTDWCTKKK